MKNKLEETAEFLMIIGDFIEDVRRLREAQKTRDGSGLDEDRVFAKRFEKKVDDQLFEWPKDGCRVKTLKPPPLTDLQRRSGG